MSCFENEENINNMVIWLFNLYNRYIGKHNRYSIRLINRVKLIGLPQIIKIKVLKLKYLKIL